MKMPTAQRPRSSSPGSENRCTCAISGSSPTLTTRLPKLRHFVRSYRALAGSGWFRCTMAGATRTSMFTRAMDHDKVTGLTIIASEAREFTVVNVVGEIDVKQIALLDKGASACWARAYRPGLAPSHLNAAARSPGGENAPSGTDSKSFQCAATASSVFCSILITTASIERGAVEVTLGAGRRRFTMRLDHHSTRVHA